MEFAWAWVISCEAGRHKSDENIGFFPHTINQRTSGIGYFELAEAISVFVSALLNKALLSLSDINV